MDKNYTTVCIPIVTKGLIDEIHNLENLPKAEIVRRAVNMYYSEYMGVEL